MGDLTEEELAMLEINVRTCQRSRMPMTVLPTEQAEKLLASARAVRKVETEIRDLRAEYRLDHVKRTDGTDAAAVDLPRHLLDRIEAALTATAEPTAGEER